MSEDEANRMIYEARLKAQRDDYSRIQGARREGREEGRFEVAKNALDEGASIEFVQKITGLDIETIKKLTAR
jgi:predicted transposase/invertase (TIGR01784 family)